MGLQNLSYVSQLQGPLREGLSDPVGTFQKFSERVSATLGNSSNKPSGLEGYSPLKAMLSRKDPVTSIDWIGLVVDSSNPQALDWYYINSIQTPGIQIETRSVFRSGKMQHYAGTLSIDNLSLTLYTDATGAAMKFASSWINTVYNNQTGNYRLPREYKKSIYVYLLDVERAIVCQFKFFGCWPTSWASYQLGNGQAENLPTVLELAVDTFSISDDENNINKQLGLLSRDEIQRTDTPSALGGVDSVLRRINL